MKLEYLRTPEADIEAAEIVAYEPYQSSSTVNVLKNRWGETSTCARAVLPTLIPEQVPDDIES